jgi:hypothetical protein
MFDIIAYNDVDAYENRQGETLNDSPFVFLSDIKSVELFDLFCDHEFIEICSLNGAFSKVIRDVIGTNNIKT